MATNIEVILWQDVDKLGKRGEKVKVAPGFARNFLYPRRLASPPTIERMKELEHEKRRQDKREAREKTAAQQIGVKVESASCTIEMEANEEGALFGAVTPQMIAEALKRENVEVEPKLIEIENAIKELGVYEVTVKLHKDVTPKCKVWVVEGKKAEGSEAGAEAKKA
ncbi:MAG: 50S ribosomal protein L9 [Planctomycetes bacterium]|nr:50S ribosomal protein L9 [Planctomycetota bacterium]